MRRRRRRIITIAGVPRQLTPQCALRFEVVRGVLTGGLTIEQGARKLGMPIEDVEQLVDGARQAVIRTLGEHALDAFGRQAHPGYQAM